MEKLFVPWTKRQWHGMGFKESSDPSSEDRHHGGVFKEWNQNPTWQKSESQVRDPGTGKAAS